MAWMAPIISAADERRRSEEKQLLAALTQQDTAQRYEFKILRGGTYAFRGKERLERILEEESRAQWELAMKLDDTSIVLRRPRDARARDALRDSSIDPYRTDLGSSRAVLIIAVMLGLIFSVGAGLLVLLQTETGGVESTTWPPIAIAIFVIAILALVLGKIALIRRR